MYDVLGTEYLGFEEVKVTFQDENGQEIVRYFENMAEAEEALLYSDEFDIGGDCGSLY